MKSANPAFAAAASLTQAQDKATFLASWYAQAGHGPTRIRPAWENATC